jgi:hypothetical protein
MRVPLVTWTSCLFRASIGRQNTANLATAAIVKRTARKSDGDISWTMLRMRKNVEPQIAVMVPSSSVATHRERAALTAEGSQTTVSVMVDPFGAWVPPSTDWSLTVPNIPPNTRSN